ncbi:MAG: DivIVA domain-containing protein [Firmicutes bacterium]|nr:DivIVA domain-containing protein [Bacillota bacterium]
MITPYDIQEKEFSRGVRGYKEDEVDAFLDKIIVDMEHLIKENEALKATISDLEKQLSEKGDTNSSVADTLKSAQNLMKEISFSAEKRARLMIKDAELEASNIKKEARQKVAQLEEENSTLKRNFDAFRNRYRNLLEAELERFDSLTNEIYPDLTINDLEDLETAVPEPEPQENKTSDTMVKQPAARPARRADMDQTMVFGKKD